MEEQRPKKKQRAALTTESIGCGEAGRLPLRKFRFTLQLPSAVSGSNDAMGKFYG